MQSIKTASAGGEASLIPIPVEGIQSKLKVSSVLHTINLNINEDKQGALL